MPSTPRPYQQAELDLHWEKPAWGYCWDPGCGKSAVATYNAARLEEAGLIDGMLVVAPSGVHRQWELDELPRHLPAGLSERTRVLCWYTSRSRTIRFEEEVDRFLAPRVGITRWTDFRVLVVSYDGLMAGAADLCKTFLKSGPKLLVVDESHLCKSPEAKRTTRVLAMAKHAPYRRILTGTMIADKPFDAYSQVKFLDPDAWKAVGCGSYQAFKAQFGEWEQRFAARAGRFYPELVRYRNLDQMRSVVARYVSRVRKEDVLPELPPKTYSRRYFELTPAQRRLYHELREEAMTVLSSGEEVTAPLVVTRMLRMQQVTCGYLPCDDLTGEGSRLVPIEGPNPRLSCLLEAAEGIETQALVWARFRPDVDRVVEALRGEKRTCARYDGSLSEDEAARSLDAFRAGDAQFLVATPSKGGTGLTLNEAKTQLWYSTGWKLSERIQAEDRSHRIGQEDSVAIVDLVGMLNAEEPTLDLGILRRLQEKRDLAGQVQGDEARSWLFPEK